MKCLGPMRETLVDPRGLKPGVDPGGGGGGGGGGWRLRRLRLRLFCFVLFGLQLAFRLCWHLIPLRSLSDA